MIISFGHAVKYDERQLFRGPGSGAAAVCAGLEARAAVQGVLRGGGAELACVLATRKADRCFFFFLSFVRSVGHSFYLSFFEVSFCLFCFRAHSTEGN